MARTATFQYQTGGGGIYDWSAATNWSTGAVPVNGGHVRIAAGPAGDVAVDNVASLNLASLYLAAGSVLEVAAGDTLTVKDGITGTGTLEIMGTGATVKVGDKLKATVAFAPGTSGGTLVLTGKPQHYANTAITGLAPGDAIVVAKLNTVVSASLSGTTLSVTGTTRNGTAKTLTFHNVQTAPTVSGVTFSISPTGGIVVNPACFVAGTRILTETGEVPVEALEVGDRLRVRHPGGLASLPIRWIGRVRVDLTRHPRPEMAAPIRIARDAVAPGVPHRDLSLSPEHGVFLDGKLIAARSLVNGMTIRRDETRRVVEYFHVETDPHAVVLAEGMAVETYLDTGNRAIFENAGVAVLHPEFQINTALRSWDKDACAKLAETPEEIAPAWQALAVRAEAMGYRRRRPRTTRDPAPALRVGAALIAPIAREADRIVFLVPRGTDQAVLESRWGCPADLTPWCNDHRRLGLAVREVQVAEGDDLRVIPMDHPGFARGWHPLESEAGGHWRWSDGAARLALDTEGPAVVTFLLAGATTYCLPELPEVEVATARAA
ncbi:MAG: Hint domain-containing protein [Rhodospirillales bacterium]|nr:Hint domain-containing protein [Rhodospirillales bacterium]